MESFEKGVCIVVFIVASLIYCITSQIQETKREMMKQGYCETAMIGSQSEAYTKCESK